MSRDQPMADPSTGQFRRREWPQQQQFILTLDLECDYGTAMAKNTYEAVGAVDRLVELLEAYEVPLTCFVQTELLDERPEAVELLRECATTVQFHPHSHTHRIREEVVVEDEIETSTHRYREFFNQDPVGYRFPNGTVQKEDYRTLAEYGYNFDASVFPSWRPNHFNNTSAPTVPQYSPAFDLFEIPFTVYSDRIRIPTALSYNRLLRQPFGWLLTERPPSVVIYNLHMHDLVTPESFTRLPLEYRLLYRQRDCGFELLERVLEAFGAKQYDIDTLDTLHTMLRDSLVVSEPAYSR